ncbi:MAG TPA: hypothetical protein VNG69_00540 [Casimicrobiaceae bacterium]|nr:hypothetical protein [Casimicrobiaceae bacterium]
MRAALIALALLIVALGDRDATAQSISRGQTLYTSFGCAASNCHGADPSLNRRQILNGAGSETSIEYSIGARADKQHLLYVFSSDPSVARDIAAWLATVAPTPKPPSTSLIEYFHAGFGHYFVTGLAAEIAALDGGQFGGWTRSGKTFKGYASGADGLFPVCRFFNDTFAPKSSHFYTQVFAECDGLRRGSTGWRYEGDVFHVESPDASGACPGGTVPVYRLYNAGQGGAPNHRYTIDTAVRGEMLGRGWVAEGLGALGVIFCAVA